MTDSDRTPDASADVQQRAGATEDYGGVPISDEELAQVWTAPAQDESAEAPESGTARPEVPEDAPAPTEPS